MERITLDHDMPVLKLAEGKFLSPFRGYCFQVSGDSEGHGDRGSSSVIGFGNVLKTKLIRGGYGNTSLYSSNISSESFPKEVMRLMAIDAIFQAGFRADDFSHEDWDLLRQFIDDCYSWAESKTL